MSFVMDCSVTIAWIFPDGANETTDRLRDGLIDRSAFVPRLWPYEIANVLVVATRKKRIRKQEWAELFGCLDVLPIYLDENMQAGSSAACLALAYQYHLSAYDAAYLELAQRKNAPLATLDKKLQQAALKAGVKLV